MSTPTHVPVMVNEVVEALAPRDNGIYVDGTFGQGGYSSAILNAAECTVWGIDRDPDAIAIGTSFEKKWPDRFHIIEGQFGEMDTLLHDQSVKVVDGIALDIGVSSTQIANPERGFSFREDGPLDMRMSQQGPTAAELINSLGETELANIIYTYGEEHYSRRIAKKIVEARKTTPILRTLELAKLVRSVVPQKGRIDPATRTFQALRIQVNDELGELERGLEAAERLLGPRGRLAVVSFHSLEDRIVKQFLKARSQNPAEHYRHLPPKIQEEWYPTFKLLNKSALKPSENEVLSNPKARSAHLRAAIRTEAPVQNLKGESK